MKRLLPGIVLIALSFMLTGCGQSLFRRAATEVGPAARSIAWATRAQQERALQLAALDHEEQLRRFVGERLANLDEEDLLRAVNAACAAPSIAAIVAPEYTRELALKIEAARRGTDVDARLMAEALCKLAGGGH